MDIKVHPKIIEALQAEEGSNQTPFSRIPGFIKRHLKTKENKEELFTLLSLIGEKEVDYLNKKLEKTYQSNKLDKELYEWIIATESGVDAKGKDIKQKLIGIAKEIIVKEMGIPVREILKSMQTELGTGIIDPELFNHDYKDESETLGEEEKNLVKLEQQVRIIMNALIMGAGHRIFDSLSMHEKYTKSLHDIEPHLYESYDKLVYTQLKDNWQKAPRNDQLGQINTGFMQLTSEGITIKADIFPVLLHEMAKGVIEYLAYVRYNNLSEKVVCSILSVDNRHSEHWMMLLGPQIYKQFIFLVKHVIAESYKNNELVLGKNEGDYIIPVIAHIFQLPAQELLLFIENILNPEYDGTQSVNSVKIIINKINNQYKEYLQYNKSIKTSDTIEQVVKQITEQFNLSQDKESYLHTTLSTISNALLSSGYDCPNRILVKKIHNYTTKHGKINDSTLQHILDSIEGFKKSRIEKEAFARIRDKQKKFPKWTKNHRGESVNIHPRFSTGELEQMKNSLNQSDLDLINTEINGIIHHQSIAHWIEDHDKYSTLLNQLTQQFITLDSLSPECIMERDNNRGLYELTTIDQLKREAQAMGGNCVSDFINQVKNGSLKIFSLRHGINSHWTIGYSTQEKTIIQIKGYVNNIKNALLTKENPDFDHVLNALLYLSQVFLVKKINDIPDHMLAFTNKGIYKQEELGAVIRNGFPYEVDFFYEKYVLSLGYHDIDIISKINFNHIEELRFEVGKHSVHFLPKSKERQIYIDISDNIILEEQMQMNEIIFILTGITKNHSLNNLPGGMLVSLNVVGITRYNSLQSYKGWPIFGQHGLKENEAIICNEDDTYSLLRRDGENFIEIMSFDAIKPPVFGETILGSDVALYYTKSGTGLIQRIGDDYREILACNYLFDNTVDSLIVNRNNREQGMRQLHIKMQNTFTRGIIKENNDGTWSEIVPCLFQDKVEFGKNLGKNHALVSRNKKFGIIKKNTIGIEVIVPFEFDKIQNSTNNYGTCDMDFILEVSNGEKHGVLGIQGDHYSVLLQCIYDEIQKNEYDDRIYIVKKDNKYSIFQRVNQTYGESCLEFIYDTITFGKDGLTHNEALVKIKGLYGIIQKGDDNNRKQIVPCIYKSIEFNNENDSNNDWVDKDFSINKIPPFGNGLYKYCTVKRNNKTYVRNRMSDGSWQEVKIHVFQEKIKDIPGLLIDEVIVKYDDKYGIMKVNNEGIHTEILPFIYDSIPDFSIRGLCNDEAIVCQYLGYHDKKYYIIKRIDNIRKQTTFDEYIHVPLFGNTYLKPNQARTKTKKGWGISEKLSDGSMITIREHKYKSIGNSLIDFVNGNNDQLSQLMHGKFVVAEKQTGGCNLWTKNNTNWIQIDSGEYKNFDFSFPGLGENESLVKDNNGKYGIIKIKNNKIKTIVSCEFDTIHSYNTDDKTILVEQNKKKMVLSMNNQGKYTPCFFMYYDEISFFQKLPGNIFQAAVTLSTSSAGSGSYLIQSNAGGSDKIINSEYIVKDFGLYGLGKEEARAKKQGGGLGIVRRNQNDDFIELLPCIYDAVGELGDSTYALQSDEAMVMYKGKMGMIKRDKDGTFKEIVEPIYHVLPGRNQKNLAENEMRGIFKTKGQPNDYYEYYEQYDLLTWSENNNKFISTKLDYRFHIENFEGFHFGKYGLPENLSFKNKSFQGGFRGLIKKDANNHYVQMYDEDEFYIVNDHTLKNVLKQGEFLKEDENGCLSIVGFNSDGDIISLSKEYYEIVSGIQGSDLIFAINHINDSHNDRNEYLLHILGKSNNKKYDEKINQSIIRYNGYDDILDSLEDGDNLFITRVNNQYFIAFYESQDDRLPTIIVENTKEKFIVLKNNKLIQFLQNNQNHLIQFQQRTGNVSENVLGDIIKENRENKKVIKLCKQFYELLGFGVMTDEVIENITSY